MTRTTPHTVALTCHPSTPSAAVRGLTASARIGGAGKLAVRFDLDADLGRIVVPHLAAPAHREELWKHTCFELFVALPDVDAYCEMNFSPSTEWAMYGFVGYRRGLSLITPQHPPRVAVRPTPRSLVVEAIIHLEELPTPAPGQSLRAALAAVIEETDGRLTYWAITHPSALPDFHHRLGFALQVSPSALGGDDLLAAGAGPPPT